MRRFKSPEEREKEEQERRSRLPGMGVALPTHLLLVIYGRQSTAIQVIKNVESAQGQAIDLLDYGLELGWLEDNRLLFIENQAKDGTIRNASGRLRIDERPGLQAVMGLIEQGKVGAVLVRAIDRLFRDESMILPMVFADTCKKHRVLILTRNDMYDFNNPQRDDLNRFIMEAIKAKDYIKNQIGDMLRARRRKAMRGEFSGHAVPCGLMLDDGRKHYVPNPYWAPVMNRLLKRFRELDANFAQLFREVVGKPIFPDLPEDILKRVGLIRLKKVAGGYAVASHSGLQYLLTNPTNIGYMVSHGRIVSKNAHPAIVDVADFWYAFDKLSKTDTDGNPIERQKRDVRYSREPRKALLAGTRSDGTAVITSTSGGVYVFQQRTKEQDADYIIKYVKSKCPNPLQDYVASIHVQTLDDLFTEHLLQRLERFRDMHEYVSQIPENLVAGVGQAIKQAALEMATGPNGRRILENWQPDGTVMKTGRIIVDNPYFRMLGMEHQEATKLVGVAATIEETKQEIARLQRDYTVNFDLMSDKELRENRLERLRLAKQLEALEKKVTEAAATQKDLQDIEHDLRNVNELWHKWDTEKKQRFIRLVTRSITLDEITYGWLKLTVEWSPFLGMDASDIALIWRHGATGKTWTEEENALLQKHYSTASKAWLSEQLPSRTWKAIMTQAYRLKIKRTWKASNTDMPDWVSVEDQRVIDTYGLSLDESSSNHCWWFLADINDECVLQ